MSLVTPFHDWQRHYPGADIDPDAGDLGTASEEEQIPAGAGRCPWAQPRRAWSAPAGQQSRVRSAISPDRCIEGQTRRTARADSATPPADERAARESRPARRSEGGRFLRHRGDGTPEERSCGEQADKVGHVLRAEDNVQRGRGQRGGRAVTA
jgi:hypothetical protein